jgi:hypothetical protein
MLDGGFFSSKREVTSMFDAKEVIVLAIFFALFGTPFILAVLKSKKNKPVNPKKGETKP